MTRIRRSLTPLYCVFLMTWVALGQNTNAPQVVAGQVGDLDFTTVVVASNTSGLSCGVDVEIHQGPGGFDPQGEILVNGQDLGATFVDTVPPLGTGRYAITTTSGASPFVGSVSVRPAGGNCQQSVTVQAEYRIEREGVLQEVFSYQGVAGLPLGGCLAGPVNYQPGVVEPGFAASSLFVPEGTQLEMTLRNSAGSQLQASSLPWDGGHLARNLSEFFPEAESFDGTWEVCLGGSSDRASDPRFSGLFITVNQSTPTLLEPRAGVDNTGVQLGTSASTTRSGICIRDAGTACLGGDRFRVTIQFRGSISEPGGAATAEAVSDNAAQFTARSGFGVYVGLFNGCSSNDRYGFFYTAGEALFDVHVTDTTTGATRTYSNDLGGPSPAVIDTSAFATCP